MTNLRFVLMVAALLLPMTISASPCAKSGMTVVKALSGDAFVIYSFREGADVAFQLPGKNISFPNGLTGPKSFVVNGVHFETLFAKTRSFMKSTEGKTDVEILNKHREYEVEYLQKSQSPLKKFVEIGPRERAGRDGQPPFTFYLWKMIDPLKPDATSQYFLTTVSDGDVAVLSAIVPDQKYENLAFQAAAAYAGSFQHILKKEQCPEETKKK